MTRHAWLNCSVGVAGDMILGALVDAGADQLFIGEVLGQLDLDGYALMFEPTQRAGVRCTHAVVAVHHEHDGHSHPHRSWRDIRSLIESASIPARVAQRALATFDVLAQVEARIHGVSVDEVHFHEIGAVDSIVDIVGACAAFESLGIDHISCSAVGSGHGSISTQHGVVSNPSPAVLDLAAQFTIPLVGLDDTKELATPTGVALVAALATSFGPMPAMSIAATGYGAGSGDFTGRANAVVVVIGETSHVPVIGEGQKVRLLECNVDDATGEVIAHTIAELLAAGAHDAWATPIVMKKGRPAFTVHALCSESLTGVMSQVLVRETGTLGLRGQVIERWPQVRQETTVNIDGYDIRVKLSNGRAKAEHDDAVIAAAALQLPLREVLARAESVAQ